MRGLGKKLYPAIDEKMLKFAASPVASHFARIFGHFLLWQTHLLLGIHPNESRKLDDEARE
jgi:hypothetical protein